jgi:regulator of sigma E protease
VVLVHELGHFLAARRFGVLVRRFAIFVGPPIVKWKRGDTEYSIRAIPFGGFVDMPGEHPDDDAKDDPRALCNKPPWQRAIVFSSGVAMNLVLAVVLFALAPVVGIKAPSPVIGTVLPGMPADEAGLKELDRLVAVNGKAVQSFTDVQMTVLLTDEDEEVSITIERDVEGAAEPKRITKTMRTVRGAMFPVVGIAPVGSTRIFQVVTNSLAHPSPAAQAGLERGDRILAVNGEPVELWREVEAQLEKTDDGPVELKIERDGREQVLTVSRDDLTTYELGMLPPVAVDGVVEGSAAEEADLRVGDAILAVGDVAWPSAQQLQEAVKAAGAGTPVTIRVRRTTGFLWWRETGELTLELAPKIREGGERPLIGIQMAPMGEEPIVGSVDPDGPAAEAGFERGDRVVAVGENKVSARDWEHLLKFLDRNAVEKAVPVVVERGGIRETLRYQVATGRPEKVTLAGAAAEPQYVALPRVTNPLTAISRGFKQAALWLRRAYMNLSQLIRRQVEPTAVMGPVGIIDASRQVAARGFGTLMEFWAMVSVLIAVLNFLPLPPFDGGHVLFLGIEAIKGSPVSMKVRNAIWTVAWIAILALFLLVTWQDILRIREWYF